MKYIKMIATMAKNRVIGNNDALPWDIFPENLEYFQEKTAKKVVIMGRRTFEIFNPLPNRRNWVITTSKINRRIKSVKWFNNPMDCVRTNPRTEKWVIGGASIFREFLPIVSEIHITILDKNYEGDCWFPIIPERYGFEGKPQFICKEYCRIVYKRT